MRAAVRKKERQTGREGEKDRKRDGTYEKRDMQRNEMECREEAGCRR